MKNLSLKTADDLNPNFIFNGVDTSLLLSAAKKEINLMDLAKKELANRGVGGDGQWVGFERSRSFWGRCDKFWDSLYKKWITVPE